MKPWLAELADGGFAVVCVFGNDVRDSVMAHILPNTACARPSMRKLSGSAAKGSYLVLSE